MRSGEAGSRQSHEYEWDVKPTPRYCLIYFLLSPEMTMSSVDREYYKKWKLNWFDFYPANSVLVKLGQEREISISLAPVSAGELSRINPI